jgi:hypothetical protein
MPKAIRFHLDENCNRAIADGLRRRGVDVTTTPEAGLIQSTDEMQAAFALSEGRVIFTQDRDFLRLHATDTFHRCSRPMPQRVDHRDAEELADRPAGLANPGPVGQ